METTLVGSYVSAASRARMSKARKAYWKRVHAEKAKKELQRVR